jgi:hypothetical protein
MNWAGGQGFAQSFLGTLQGLTALERAQLEAQEFRERKAREQQAREVAGRTLGRAGEVMSPTQIYGGMNREQAEALAAQTAGMEDQQGIAAQTIDSARFAAKAPRSAIPTGEDLTRGRAYGEAEAYQDYARGLAGIDPEKAMTARVQGLQLEETLFKKAQRDDFRAFVKKSDEDIAKINNFVESGNAQGLISMAKSMGVDARLKENKDGSVTFEIYQNGKLVKSTNSIAEAGNLAQDAYTRNMLTSGARKFATSPAELATMLNSVHQMDARERELRVKEQLVPEQIAQMRASTENSLAAARKTNMDSDRLAEMQKLNKELNELLKDPKKNAAAILALATRMETMFPEVYTKQGKITRDGEEILTTVGLLTTSAGRALEAGGVVRLPVQVRGIVQQAAERAKGDRKKFANDPTIKNILKAQPQIKITDLEEVAFGPATQTEALPGATTGPQPPEPSKTVAGQQTFFRFAGIDQVQAEAARGNPYAVQEIQRRKEIERTRGLPVQSGTFGLNP